MSIRWIGALCGVALLVGTTTGAFAQTLRAYSRAGFQTTTGETTQGKRATTVKSSKSNTSDRMGGGGGKGGTKPARFVTSLDVRTQTEYGTLRAKRLKKTGQKNFTFGRSQSYRN